LPVQLCVPVASSISLLSLIARHGSAQAPVTDFAARRKNYLTGLEKFLPVKFYSKKTIHNSSLPVQHLRATGAFIKKALANHGGHLQAGEKKLFYVRIPKVANTSLAYALLKTNFPDLPDTINSTQINLLADSWLEHTVHPALKEQTGFTVVRHPLHRLVSVYRDFFEQGNADFIYNGYLFGVLTKTISFEEFLFRISKIPERLKDQHFRPQSCFLEVYRKRKIPVRIFKLEQPDELQTFLSGLGLRLLHLNQSLTPYDYRSYYSVRTLLLARKMYASDFSLFNYDQ
jgi:hypothetical protein